MARKVFLAAQDSPFLYLYIMKRIVLLWLLLGLPQFFYGQESSGQIITSQDISGQITTSQIITSQDISGQDSSGQGFIYEHAAFPSCHASTLVETTAGDLLVAFFGGSYEGHPDNCIWLCRLPAREGAVWSAPVCVADGMLDGVKTACYNPVLFQIPEGELILFYKVGTEVQKWRGFLKRSYDGGHTWSEPEAFPENQLGPVRNKPLLLPRGPHGEEGTYLLCGSSFENEGWRVHFEWAPVANGQLPSPSTQGNPAQRSSTQGHVTRDHFTQAPDAWYVGAPINQPEASHQPNKCTQPDTCNQPESSHQPEASTQPNTCHQPDTCTQPEASQIIQPTLWLKPDGEVQAFFRNRDPHGYIMTSRLLPGDSLWSRPTPTSLPGNNSGLDGVSLEDGSFLLVYNHVSPDTPGARSPLCYAITRDGTHWSAPVTLEDTPGQELSYPAVIRTQDGQIHLSYTWHRTHIKHLQPKIFALPL